MRKNIIFASVLSFASLSLNLFAATVTIDVTDSDTLTTSHLSSDTIQLLKSGTDSTISRVAGDAAHGVNSTSALLFSQGADFTPDTTNDSFILHTNSSGFDFGAAAGINYARFDMDRNGTYETVVEFDFGSTANPADDVITRYAYNDDASNLEISSAVVAFNSIPEPSSSMLLLGVIPLLARRKR